MITNVVNFTPTTGSDGQTGAAQQLGQEDFLNLLVMQLQNQDPLEPVKNEDLVAQLATFSSLEQQIATNDKLDEIALLQTSLNNNEALSLIGKQITVPGDTLTLAEGESSMSSFILDEAATSVSVSILDSDGQVVRTLDLGEREIGLHDVEWDGRDDAGLELADGTYTFKVNATGEGNASVSASLITRVVVDGITFNDGYAYLLSGDRSYLLSDIIEVREK